jgi:two-component system, response regulator PdtaR
MLSYLFADNPAGRSPFIHAFTPLPENESISLRGKRAVIVEDEGITQLQLRKLLRSEGVSVVGAASDGQEGVALVLRERPDFVLMDIRMPIMDGIEAAERILAEYRVCIVMLTAFSDEAYRQRAAGAGACAYIVKPVTVETLVPQLKAAYQKYHRLA